MSAKTAIGFQQARSATAAAAAAESEIVTVLAPGDGNLPRRRRLVGSSAIERFVAVLASLLDNNTTIPELNFTKSLEARASATLRAMTCDLESYALFASDLAAPALPATHERLTEWIDHLEAAGQKPATIARKLATLGSVHSLIGAPSPTNSQLVRDTMKGMRRRQGTAQKQAMGLRLGEPIGDVAVKGITLACLLDACGSDLAGLRDAALLSLGYDAGLRVSELVGVSIEHLEVQEDGNGLLDLPSSKTDQEGQGAVVWVSSETMRRIALWREAASIRSGPLFRRVAVTRKKGMAGRRALSIRDLAYNARVDSGRMAAVPTRQASVTYCVGDDALTVAAVHGIIRKRALEAADFGLVDLTGDALAKAIKGLSTHSLRVGLTQDLFANGEDAGPIAQALRWSSIGTALRYGKRLAPKSNAAARMLAKRRR